MKDKWWISGGAGIGLDAPAFYDIKNKSERKFYFGSAVVFGTGYELWQKGKFAIDVQSRMHYGKMNLDAGSQQGMAYSFLVGINWY